VAQRNPHVGLFKRFHATELLELLGRFLTAKDARTCDVQVYHDAEHPSAIQLPLR
jgi:hypothetical protein